MGSGVQLPAGCLPDLCFPQFSVAQVLVGLRKQLTNNFVFLTYACAVSFNDNNMQYYQFHTVFSASRSIHRFMHYFQLHAVMPASCVLPASRSSSSSQDRLLGPLPENAGLRLFMQPSFTTYRKKGMTGQGGAEA